MAIIGYLAPNGNFTRCTSNAHAYCATSICKKLGIEKQGYQAEKYLLDIGYVCFRSHDAFMNHYKTYSDGLNFLTAAQLNFIKMHENDWNNIEQVNDVINMVKMSQDLKEDFGG